MLETLTLESLCSRISSGGTPSRKRADYFASDSLGHLWVKSKELLDGSIEDTEEKITDIGLNNSAAKYYPDKTILIAMYGANVGQLGWLRRPATVNQAICGLIVDEKKADWRFVFYSLLQNRGNLTIQAQGAAQQNLNQDLIRQFAIPVPPLHIQSRIADIVSAYDELIENSQRRIRILDTMARALYREWFVHFRFPGHEKLPRVASLLGDIPQGWEVKLVRHFGEVITGKTPSKANPNFYGDDMPFVKTPDMHGNMFILGTNERLSTAGSHSQANKTLPPGSICVSCIGTIGVVSITTEDCQTNQQINSVVLANEAYREFLFFRFQDTKQTLENLGANGATMGNVNKGKFESVEIVCPTDELLVQYHRLVESMFSEILSLFRQIQNLRQVRDLLLPRLLSGQVALDGLNVKTHDLEQTITRNVA
jgi:type I restriction enzyme S subunit